MARAGSDEGPRPLTYEELLVLRRYLGDPVLRLPDDEEREVLRRSILESVRRPLTVEETEALKRYAWARQQAVDAGADVGSRPRAPMDIPISVTLYLVVFALAATFVWASGERYAQVIAAPLVLALAGIGIASWAQELRRGRPFRSSAGSMGSWLLSVAWFFLLLWDAGAAWRFAAFLVGVCALALGIGGRFLWALTPRDESRRA